MVIDWQYLNIEYSSRARSLEVRVGVPWSTHWAIRLLWNSPVTITSQLMPLFVAKSTFFARSIVHPGGGGAAKLVCEQCGAEYPYVANPSPCAFCSVMKESGITVNIGHRTREWRWSDWGWAVMNNGYYIGESITNPTPAIRPTRFKAKHEAMDIARQLEIAEWERNPSPFDYHISVEPYPIKPVQPARPDPAIMSSIFDGRPGIGAKPGVFGHGKLDR